MYVPNSNNNKSVISLLSFYVDKILFVHNIGLFFNKETLVFFCGLTESKTLFRRYQLTVTII